MVGLRFGCLEVIEFVGSFNKRRKYLCKCACSNQIIVRGGDLRSGKQISCGCKKKERISRYGFSSKKHGMSESGSYRSWCAMRLRCYNKNSTSYKWYGARGIKVCKKWESFDSFYKDMGERPKGMTLDRIDSNKNYEPSNCKWSTPSEQALNRRKKCANHI